MSSDNSQNGLQDNLPQVSGRRLFASTPERQELERAKEQKLTQYRRNYWQDYKTKIRRVFGTIGLSEFEFWKSRAAQNERTVWGEIYNCACAHAGNAMLATPEILQTQSELQIDIRRIGNNLNQAVRLGHVKAKQDGSLYADNGDEIGQSVLALMTSLEQRVTRFESDVTQLIRSGANGHGS